MNEVFIADQTKVFLLSILFGAVFCALYDLFRVLRKTVVKKKTTVFFADILYWLLVTCGTLYITLIYCTGYVRAYVLIAIVIGFVIFRILFSGLLFNVIYRMILLTKKLVLLLLVPFELLKRIANNAAKRVLAAVRRTVKAVKNKNTQKKQPQESKKA